MPLHKTIPLKVPATNQSYKTFSLIGICKMCQPLSVSENIVTGTTENPVSKIYHIIIISQKFFRNYIINVVFIYNFF
jgi:hypothetical protein